MKTIGKSREQLAQILSRVLPGNSSAVCLPGFYRQDYRAGFLPSGRMAPADCISSGIEPLDQVLRGGYPAGALTVLAGRPGMGKTALALLAVQAAISGSSERPILLLGPSRSSELFIHRLLAVQSSIPCSHLDGGLLDTVRADRLDRAIRWLDDCSRFCPHDTHDTPQELLQIATKVAGDAVEPAVIIVDALERFGDAMPAVIANLQKLAHESGAAIVSTWRMVTPGSSNTRPGEEELSSLETTVRTAECCLLVHRDDYYPAGHIPPGWDSPAEIHIVRGFSGRREGTIPLKFDTALWSFRAHPAYPDRYRVMQIVRECIERGMAGQVIGLCIREAAAMVNEPARLSGAENTVVCMLGGSSLAQTHSSSYSPDPPDARALSIDLDTVVSASLAYLLTVMDADTAADLLPVIPCECQATVIKVLAIGCIPPEIQGRINHALLIGLPQVMADAPLLFQKPSLGKAVHILNRTDRGTEMSILEFIEEDDPDLAEEIKKRMFTFEDVRLLDRRAIQQVLREVDTKELALALKNTRPCVRQCIYANMSWRAASMLREDMEFMGPVRVRDTEDAQQRIVNIIRRLAEAGEIVVTRGGDERLIP